MWRGLNPAPPATPRAKWLRFAETLYFNYLSIIIHYIYHTSGEKSSEKCTLAGRNSKQQKEPPINADGRGFNCGLQTAKISRGGAEMQRTANGKVFYGLGGGRLGGDELANLH